MYRTLYGTAIPVKVSFQRRLTVHYSRGRTQQVWQRVHMDFAVKDCENLLLLIDAYSKWTQVFSMHATTSAKTVKHLETICSIRLSQGNSDR